MSEWKKVKIGDFLTESKIIAIESNAAHRITVRLNCKGVEQRSLKAEKEGATKYYTRKSGQFIYGKQNIHKGAFGIIPQELDGFTSSADLPAFDVDLSKCIPEWICICLQKDEYYKTLQKNVKGVGSQRLAVNVFLDSEIPLPPVEKQVEIIKKIKLQLQKTEQLSVEIESQKNYIKQLRQNILQEAIEGKLTAEWRKQNPVQKGNPNYDAESLFEQIQKERINEKKQKELSPITDEEKPFKIPEGWKWVHFGDVIEIATNIVESSDYKDMIQVSPDDIEKNTGRLIYPLKTVREKEIISVNHIFSKNMLIYSKIRPRLRKIVYVDFDGLCSADMYPLKTTLKYFYIKNLMLSDYFDLEVYKFDNRVKMPKINQPQLNSIKIPIPPMAEQKVIVIKVEKYLQCLSALEKQILEREQITKQLMQSILKDAFEG